MTAELIYLDYNATTPAASEVIDAVLPWLSRPSNPSSVHRAGRAARAALEDAREQVAVSIGGRSPELYFTSGATESNSIAIRTAVAASRRRRVLTSAVEHKAVLEPLQALAREGWTIELLPVGRHGGVDVADVRAALADDVALVSLHLANNEVGTIQPVKEVAEAAHAVGALVHTDATQALGKIKVSVSDLDVDLASFSSHKIYGPQGIGALFSRRRLKPIPLALGGGQERGSRPGTENVAAAVGFGAAAELSTWRLDEYGEAAQRHTDLFLAEVTRLVPGVTPVLEPHTSRLANTLSLRCHGADAEALVSHTPGLAFSTGSAFSSMVPEPSHVLQAMLRDVSAAAECVRISTGWPTSDAEILIAAKQFSAGVRRIRELTA